MINRLKNQEERMRPETVGEVILPVMVLGEYQDVVAIRGYGNRKYTNVPYVVGILANAGDDYEWGYGGCGPLDFAANILMHFSDHDHVVTSAFRNAFCVEFLLNMPKAGGRIPKEFIFAFIEKMKAARPDLLELAQQEFASRGRIS